ncbi:MAG: hypothetical protein FWG06_04490, partial [Clostridiales bacterium]|nr:hypothetical protein [Clostridiales bacterium]
MNKRNTFFVLLITLLLAAVPLCSSCGGKGRDELVLAPQEVILEPGLPTASSEPAESAKPPHTVDTKPVEPPSEDGFTDL